MKKQVPTDIPFNRPFIVGKELFYIAQAVLGGHLAGDGVFSKRCSEWMETTFAAHKVLLTHSCTAALEMAAMLCDIQPGDEVIMPSYTFVSTANAFALRGARIRFVDIRPDTLNIDEKAIEATIGPRTKAIVPVHYGGVGADMDAIMSLANKHGLVVVEDAAQGVTSTYKQRYLGTIGHLGAFSFHETKNLISGEGGALVVNDDQYVARAEIIREKGTNRNQFFRGQVDKYTWVDLGSSYLPSEIIAAFLFAQLEEAETISTARQKVVSRYGELLRPLEDKGLIQLPVCPPYCRHNAHMYYIILRSPQERAELLRHLNAQGILAVFHYIPLHTSPMGRRMGYEQGQLPVTEDLSRRLVRLPCYFGLSASDQDRVASEISSFLG